MIAIYNAESCPHVDCERIGGGSYVGCRRSIIICENKKLNTD